MKRFKWQLQRLLDVTVQKERAIRAKLFDLSRRIADVHSEIFRHQASLRSVLAQLAEKNLEKRLPEQQVFMKCSLVEKERLDQLQERLNGLKHQRAEEISAFTKTKSSRETLERLKEEAIRRYTRKINREQQKQQDESAGISFVRKIIKQRAHQSGMRSAT